MLRHDMTALLVSSAAALAACGGTRDPGREPRVPEAPPADAATFVAKAERELAAIRTLDYRGPRDIEPRWEQLRRASDLLYQACKRGDRPSCWRYFGSKHTDEVSRAHEIAMEMGRHCLSGDGMSCRALTLRGPREYGFAHHRGLAETRRMCEAGLAAACVGLSEHHRFVKQHAESRAWLQKACDLGDAASCEKAAYLDREAGKPEDAVAALTARSVDRARAECGQGYALRCQWLMYRHDGDLRRMEETAEVGCRAGLLEECALLTGKNIRPELRAYAAEEICTHRGN